jgi:hypothetical protein
MKIKLETENGAGTESTGSQPAGTGLMMGKGAWIAIALAAVAAPFFIYSIVTRPTYVPVHVTPPPPLFPAHPVASKAVELALDVLQLLTGF